MLRKKLLAVCTASTLAFGIAGAPAAEAQVIQDGLVSVSIGNVNVLRDVDVAVAANVVANICAQDVTVAVLAAVDQTGSTFECNQRGSGRPVAVTT
jgi:hypothetical protein